MTGISHHKEAQGAILDSIARELGQGQIDVRASSSLSCASLAASRNSSARSRLAWESASVISSTLCANRLEVAHGLDGSTIVRLPARTGGPPRLRATTGRPQAIASTTTQGASSCKLGNTKTDASVRMVRSSASRSTQPLNSTRLDSPRRSVCRRSRLRSGPSPHTMRCQPGKCSSERIASETPFQASRRPANSITGRPSCRPPRGSCSRTSCGNTVALAW